NVQAIVIEQADPNTMYVPYYDPATVYGAWPYAEYPPYYFGYPSYIGAGVIAAGLAFGTAWAIGRWGNYWGGGCNWGNRNVYVNHRTTNIGNGWQHNPAHRQGGRYNNANVQQRFGNNNLKAGAADRMDFRGRDGQQVLRPNQDRPGAGDRSGDRAGGRGGLGPRAVEHGEHAARWRRCELCRSRWWWHVGRRRRLPRRWWRWRRPWRRRWPALRYRAEARRYPARPSRQRPRLLPLQLS